MNFPTGTLAEASFLPAPFQGLRRGYYGAVLDCVSVAKYWVLSA